MNRPRHTPSQAHLLARLRRALAPRKLPASKVSQISLYQHINLDAIANGTADSALMFDYVANALCWHRVAQRLGIGEAEMDAQLQVATRLVQRFKRHGRVAFDGPDLQAARLGVMVVDQLAETADEATAVEASTWALHTANRMLDASHTTATHPTPQPQEHCT